jgi:hypothetical protein
MNIAKMAEHVAIHQSFSLYRVRGAAATAGRLLLQESYYDYDYYLNSRLRAAQVRAWRRHYVLIIIFNYLLRTTRAGIPNREREQLYIVPIVFLLHSRRAFIHLLHAALLHTHSEPAQ